MMTVASSPVLSANRKVFAVSRLVVPAGCCQLSGEITAAAAADEMRHAFNLFNIFKQFLPRDACTSAAYAVVRCPSVRLSVCLSHPGIVLKWINVLSNYFNRRVATPF